MAQQGMAQHSVPSCSTSRAPPLPPWTGAVRAQLGWSQLPSGKWEPKGSVGRKCGERVKLSTGGFGLPWGVWGCPQAPLWDVTPGPDPVTVARTQPTARTQRAGARGQAAIAGSPIALGDTPTPSQPLMGPAVSPHAPWAVWCPSAAAFGLAPCRMWPQMLVLSPSPRTPSHCSCEPPGCPPLHLGVIESPRSLLSS